MKKTKADRDLVNKYKMYEIYNDVKILPDVKKTTQANLGDF